MIMKFEDMTKEELREAVLDQSMSMQLALVTSPCIPLGFARGAGSVYIKVRDLLTDIKSGNTPDMPDARAYIALMETLERRERFSLHAACLERDGGGVLLAGPSGAGKSTLTFALAGAGLSLLSDDVVFLDPRRAEVRALGFADALGITAAGARLFPQLRGALDAAPEDGFPKRLVRLEDILPEATLSQSCAPRVLVFPSVDPDSLSALTPLDPGEAMLRLVPDVLLTEPRATQSHLAALAALLGQVRTYTLRSGADLQRAAELVAGALAA